MQSIQTIPTPPPASCAPCSMGATFGTSASAANPRPRSRLFVVLGIGAVAIAVAYLVVKMANKGKDGKK